MRCVIQRVRRAGVTVGDEIVAEIGSGLLVLVAVEKGDDEGAMHDAGRKIRELRIFNDEAGKMNRDVREVGDGILAVSQFTLARSIARGRRPRFDQAEEPERARAMVELFVALGEIELLRRPFDNETTDDSSYLCHPKRERGAWSRGRHDACSSCHPTARPLADARG